MEDDRTLLRRYAESGDAAAFAAVVGRHVDAVYSTARRVVGGDAHLAEDVTQQVFAALARQAARVSEHPVISAWLHRTTHNQAAQLVRSEQRRKRREREAMAMNERDELDWRHVGPVLDEMVDQLRESDRVVVLLRFFERQPFAKIGAALGISEDAARVRTDRALDRLRVMLERRSIRSSAAALAVAMTAHAVSAAPAGLGASVAGAAAAVSTASLPASLLGSLMASAKTCAYAAGAVAFVATLGFTGLEFQRLRSAQIELEQARRDHAALSARGGAVAERLAVAERTTLEKAGKRAGPAGAEENEVAIRSASRRQDADEDEGRAFLGRHPEVSDALRAYTDARTEFSWSGFFEEQRLTPEQILVFKELMREQTMFGSGGVQPGRTLQLPAGTAMSGPDVNRRLEALLGEEGYASYRAYQKILPARATVAVLGSQLAFMDHPLTADQAVRLVSMVTNHQTSRPGAKTRAVNWRAFEAQARTVLREEQMVALEAGRARQEFQEAFSRTIEKASAGADHP